MDLDDLEKRFTNIKKELKKEDENLKELVQEISQKDETKQSYDVLYEIFTDEERDYHNMNEAYKRYISQYSKEYIEMSEYYYGPELPFDVYQKEKMGNKRSIKEGDTYLDTAQDVKELYALFIFFMFFDMYTKNDRQFQ
tara:strand:- start:39 stop:455 length:417 start_codon:yes stop_codon:yes gene_type:complete